MLPRWSTCLLLWLFSASVGVLAAEEDFRGRITESVVCTSAPEQRYALYVPSNYRADRKWPVIFAFDAGARGLIPVQRLQEGAERHGYLVAGSLNSRNGPWSANAAAVQAMIGDVEARFALDPKRIYTTGLSGGARVATQVALTGLAKGVIACGASFPTPDEIPDRVPFAYFAVTGVEDFNYCEIRRLVPALEKRKATFRVVAHGGGHEWAPAGIMTEAVAWLELQAMRSGAAPRDKAFLAAHFQARLQLVPAVPEFDRFEALKSVVADFDGVADLGRLRKELATLARSESVTTEQGIERECEKREKLALTLLAEAARRNARERKRAVELALKFANGPENEPMRRTYRRVVLGYCSIARETARDLCARGEAHEAAGLLEVATLLQPRHTRLRLELARARALDGDRPGALADLAQVAALGFSDAARIESDSAFAKLRAEAGYRTTLEHIRANPPESTDRGGRWMN